MKALLTATFFIFSTLLMAQDIITTTSADEIQAKIITITATEVTYKKFSNPDGPTYIINKSEIFSIKYPNGDKEIYSTSKPAPAISSQTVIPANAKTTTPEPETPKVRKNSVFLDLAGNGIYTSINYERLIMTSDAPKSFVAIKAGYTPFVIYNAFNITGSYNIGDGKNSFEVGAGGGYYFVVNYGGGNSSNQSYPYFTPILGYRRMTSSGFLFRVYMSTYTQQNVRTNYNGYYSSSPSYSYSYSIYPFLGLSLGFSF